ncbi:MAG: hypothetical protein KKA22_10305 [Gammaproteobacteria bacterium]|nr:hypothetical protein [Gammaproteobacteria bacterium]MBU1408524.1 hypothetical protein [Gammaproteobacteria bacterium]MBU1532336.1 hypothetical protein [Gammaproteobacteria bacterium]
MPGKILLVEGPEDREFFFAALKYSGLGNVQIEPKIPRESHPDVRGNGVDNLLTALELQVKKLFEEDGPEALGIVLDADHSTGNPSCDFGFTVRRNQVADILTSHGWHPALSASSKGEIFSNPNGLPPIGLWVMPDHQSDGMLEDFVASLVIGHDQQTLLIHAQSTVSNLPTKLFDPVLHTTKANVATWRAWQKPPGTPLNRLVENGILDLSLNPASDFTDWLKATFL